METFILFPMSQRAVAGCHLERKSIVWDWAKWGTRTKNNHKLGNWKSTMLPCQGETQMWNVVVQRERAKQHAEEFRCRSHSWFTWWCICGKVAPFSMARSLSHQLRLTVEVDISEPEAGRWMYLWSHLCAVRSTALETQKSEAPKDYWRAAVNSSFHQSSTSKGCWKVAIHLPIKIQDCVSFPHSQCTRKGNSLWEQGGLGSVEPSVWHTDDKVYCGQKSTPDTLLAKSLL